MTTPWNRTNYLKRINYLKNLSLKTKKSVAFFQDEYFNIDLTNKLISDLKVQHVYSVAPESEWNKLYSNIPQDTVIHSYLTGYIDIKDVEYCSSKNQNVKRSNDIGYRTGWSSQSMYRLGSWGSLKFKLAEAFIAKSKHLKLDIGIGAKSLKGNKWLDFLMNSKYTIGVESGSSLLDKDGSINNAIQGFLIKNPEASYEEVEAKCFYRQDCNLNLKAISPRIFEAAMTRTCQILVEGHYNGLLSADAHYIPIKSDFSNIEAVIQKLDDVELRNKIINNTYRDLVLSDRFTYSTFVTSFYNMIKPDKVKITTIDQIAYHMSLMTDFISWIKAAIWSNLAVKILKIVKG